MASEVQMPRYTVIIQWSDEDKCYVASLPEWRPHAYASAHGDTYEEAAKNAREILELLMEDEFGKPVDAPAPRLFRYPGADAVDLPDAAGEQAPSSAVEPRAKQSA